MQKTQIQILFLVKFEHQNWSPKLQGLYLFRQRALRQYIIVILQKSTRWETYEGPDNIFLSESCWSIYSLCRFAREQMGIQTHMHRKWTHTHTFYLWCVWPFSSHQVSHEATYWETEDGTETFISFYCTGWLVWKYFGLRRVIFKEVTNEGSGVWFRRGKRGIFRFLLDIQVISRALQDTHRPTHTHLNFCLSEDTHWHNSPVPYPNYYN